MPEHPGGFARSPVPENCASAAIGRHHLRAVPGGCYEVGSAPFVTRNRIFDGKDSGVQDSRQVSWLSDDSVGARTFAATGLTL